MEFWGVEVKAGEPVKYDPGFKTYLHLSQAALGEFKKDKGSNSVPILVEINGQKLVLGILSSDNCPQISFDLVFEKEFTLSHNNKNASVFFCGYKSTPEDPNITDTDSDSEEAVPSLVAPQKDIKKEKRKPAIDEPSAKKIEPKQHAKPVDVKKSNAYGEDDDDDNESEEDDSDSDEDMFGIEEDSDDEDDNEDSSDEEVPRLKKAEAGKKRPAESITRTPILDKKTKLVSPSGQKKVDDGHKSGHTATPHPTKKPMKPHESNDKKSQTPKSAGQVTCKSCSRTFNSQNALDSHTKAKHSAGK